MSVTGKGSLNIKVPCGCLKFDGDNINGPYVSSNHGSSFDIASGNSVSMAGWVNITSAQWFGYLLSKRNDTNQCYSIGVGNESNDRKINLFGGGPTNQEGNTTIPLNTWTHIGGTIDGNAASFYYNGNPDGTGTVDGISSNTVSVYIGARDGSAQDSEYSLSGMICNVQLWSGVALTVDEMKKVYNGIDVQTSNRVGHWKFDDRKGTTLEDSSSFENDGTITNAIWTDRDIRCWGSRWDEDNYGVVCETFIDACDRNYLASNVKPGILYDKTNNLGWRIIYDRTFKSSNTLILEPLGGYGLSGVRQSRTVVCKNYSDTFVNDRVFRVKLETLRKRLWGDYT